MACGALPLAPDPSRCLGWAFGVPQGLGVASVPGLAAPSGPLVGGPFLKLSARRSCSPWSGWTPPCLRGVSGIVRGFRGALELSDPWRVDA